jgi:hypothetical protein
LKTKHEISDIRRLNSRGDSETKREQGYGPFLEIGTESLLFSAAPRLCGKKGFIKALESNSVVSAHPWLNDLIVINAEQPHIAT